MTQTIIKSFTSHNLKGIAGLINLCRVLITIALISNFSFASEIDLVRYVASEKNPDRKESYFIDLLTLALEQSKTQYGDYQLQAVDIDMAQGRSSIMLQQNEYIDLTWRMTSKALEQQLQAIYFPITKGLMGSRVFIIRNNSQYLFKKNMSLRELKMLSLGQGHTWPDTEILLKNGFKVIGGHADALIAMLNKKRFDYYPRALHEPWVEIADESELVVEKHLMLRYPAPMFFFVNKNNKRLQQRLNLGLKSLLDSGEFEQFFIHHKITSGILTKAKVHKRTIFDLPNPLLSEKSKALLADKRLWIEFN